MSKKRVSERIYLDQFLKAQGWALPPEDVTHAVPPAPDFVIRLPSGRLLGVEVTEISRDDGARSQGGSRVRQDESHSARWIRDLAESYYDGGGAPLLAKVILGHTHPSLPPERTTELRERIVPLLREAGDRLALDATDRIELRDDRETLLATLHVRRLPDSQDRYSRWQLLNDRVGWVRTQTADQLQARVDEKAANLPAYRQAVQDVVLLIVANHFFRSGMIRFEATVESRGFEVVYLLHYPEAELQKIG